MHSRVITTLAVLAGLSVVPAAAHAAPRAISIDPDHASATYPGALAPGFNMTWYESKTTKQGTCGASVQDYCDTALVHFTSPLPLESSELRFRIEGFAHSDFDLRMSESDSDGTRGPLVANPIGDIAASSPLGTLDPRHTFAGDWETLNVAAEPDSWYLVEVVYFTVPGDETFTGKLSWTGAFAPEEPPV